MSRANDRSLKHESNIKQILAKVHEMCKQAIEDQCVQPAFEEELEEMLSPVRRMLPKPKKGESKMANKFTTLTETMSLTCDSVVKSELVKAPNGMLFKLFCDVHNGGNCWNIYVWSNALSRWNQLASKDIIPDIQHFSYFNCYASGSTSRPNPIILSNWNAMKKFIDVFSSNLSNSVE